MAVQKWTFTQRQEQLKSDVAFTMLQVLTFQMYLYRLDDESIPSCPFSHNSLRFRQLSSSPVHNMVHLKEQWISSDASVDEEPSSSPTSESAQANVLLKVVTTSSHTLHSTPRGGSGLLLNADIIEEANPAVAVDEWKRRTVRRTMSTEFRKFTEEDWRGRDMVLRWRRQMLLIAFLFAV